MYKHRFSILLRIKCEFGSASPRNLCNTKFCNVKVMLSPTFDKDYATRYSLMDTYFSDDYSLTIQIKTKSSLLAENEQTPHLRGLVLSGVHNIKQKKHRALARCLCIMPNRYFFAVLLCMTSAITAESSSFGSPESSHENTPAKPCCFAHSAFAVIERASSKEIKTFFSGFQR
ncbi:hypothetical protein SAMN02745132_02981 [Enterovibrio nigricans DSM 22720]|uniref:Uncharacterized protein n=1 Tax=Enterovibrio nigricans DSM 22720 TaxID=1121868 RepID=A0A1T4V1H5_9GAMM|nr:hypothetical protein SAMN02745132_02981 [Enterovibrio nigricans DSM 22720]